MARELAMYKRLSALLTTGSVALAMSLAATSPSAATTTTTWTVKPGGSFSASGSVRLTDTKNQEPNSCKSMKLTGKLSSGSGLPGANIGSVTRATFGKCMWATLAATFTAHGLPWKLNAVKYDSSNGVTTGSVQGIGIAVSGVECFFRVDGTAGDANDGLIKFTYTNSTGKLKLQTTGGNLHFYDVSGCAGVISNDDPIAPSGSLTLSPKQKISSP